MPPLTQTSKKYLAAAGAIALSLAAVVGFRSTPAAVVGAYGYECASPNQIAAASSTVAFLEAEVASTTRAIAKNRAKLAKLDRLAATASSAESRVAAASTTLAARSSALADAQAALGAANASSTSPRQKSLKVAVEKAKAAYSAALAAAKYAGASYAAAQSSLERARAALGDLVYAREDLEALVADLAEARAELAWAAANMCASESGNLCLDGADNDADGAADCADSDCNLLQVCGGGEDACANGIDDDLDGRADCADDDCAGVGECPATAGIEASLVSTSAVLTSVATEPGEADVVSFDVSFQVTAVGDDVIIPKVQTLATSTYPGSGVTWWFTDDSTPGAASLVAGSLSASGSTSRDTATAFAIQDGDTRSFRLTGVMTALEDGFVGVRVTGINWTNDPGDATPDNVYSAGLEDFATPLVRVNVL